MTTGEKVSYSITRLGLVWLTMMEVRKVLVPIKPLEEVEAYFDERASSIQRGLDGGEAPPRAFPSPKLSSFCKSWCCHLTRCIDDGA